MITALVGPTCVGKTSVSIALAKAIGAEIVSVDSRQIYKEIAIGTAKPSNEQLVAVPHHFISEHSISDPVTAVQFADLARARIKEIESRASKALLVGGSTLYLHALLFGMDDVPETDPAVRRRLLARLGTEGLPSLAAELAQRDPITYERIDRANPRRVLRALEVLGTTGRPISSYQTGTPTALSGARVLVLDRAREDLHQRIDARVDAMIATGLIAEVKRLLETGLKPQLEAVQTIGYAEVMEFLEGRTNEPSMIEAIKRNTRRYAKRQLTWFRRYEVFRWVQVYERDDFRTVADRVLNIIGR